MSMEVGLWIDHRQAVTVALIDGREQLEVIESNMEKHIRPAGGSCSKSPYGPQDVMKEDSRERKFRLHLKRYFEEVFLKVKDADALLVMGPGPAKAEFHKHIKGSALANRIVAIETAEKLTHRQLAARVRQQFTKQDSLLV